MSRLCGDGHMQAKRFSLRLAPSELIWRQPCLGRTRLVQMVASRCNL